MLRFELIIEGPPRGKGRHRTGQIRFKSGATQTIHYPDAQTESFEAYVKLAVVNEMRRAGMVTMESGTPVFVGLNFYLPIPKSVSVLRWALMRCNAICPTSKPDLDNLEKAVMDAVNQVLFHDDCQVVGTLVNKQYDDGRGPRVELIVYSLGYVGGMTDTQILQSLSDEQREKVKLLVQSEKGRRKGVRK